jgi:hypothetical protein
MDYEWYLRFLLYFGMERCCETDIILARARLHDESKTLSFIEKFRIDRNSILFQLSKQLDFSTEQLSQIYSLGTLNNYEQKWQINIKFDKTYLSNLIQKEVTPFTKDSSQIYRSVADYMSYFGNNKNVLNATLKAILKKPLKFINYKYFGRAVLNSLVKTG